MNLSRLMLALFRRMAALPYVWLRRLGNVAGVLLYLGVPERRRIADINLRLCFPTMSGQERQAIIRAHCRYFARSFLDRFILWYRPAAEIERLVRVEGLEHFEAHAGKPLILLAPHFLGMDAGGTRLTIDHRMFTMFANQKNKVFNEAMREGRSRFSGAEVVSRQEGLRGAIRKIRQGIPFYFLPDMDLGARDSLFVPFFGVPAATVTSVARLAQMTGARVVPCVTLMTADGYLTRFYPAWEDFPGDDLEAATRRMNAFIEARVLEAPAQYLWTHKRFKTRPPGEPGVYGRDVAPNTTVIDETSADAGEAARMPEDARMTATGGRSGAQAPVPAAAPAGTRQPAAATARGAGDGAAVRGQEDGR